MEVVGDLDSQCVRIYPKKERVWVLRKIEVGAIFIADSHQAPYRETLSQHLKEILDTQHIPPQIFLMGDIFDLLVGSIPSLVAENKEVLDLIEALSAHCEMIYLEGNHDFNLKDIPQFKNVELISRDNQPVFFYISCGDLKLQVALAHGDIGVGGKYEIYTHLIRMPFILRLLEGINHFMGLKMLEKLQKHLEKKPIKVGFGDFLSFAKKRLEYYDKYGGLDLVIEGHFHFGKFLQTQKNTYISLNTFSCKKRYFIVECCKDSFIFRECVLCSVNKEFI